MEHTQLVEIQRLAEAGSPLLQPKESQQLTLLALRLSLLEVEVETGAVLESNASFFVRFPVLDRAKGSHEADDFKPLRQFVGVPDVARSVLSLQASAFFGDIIRLNLAVDDVDKDPASEFSVIVH